MQHLIAGVVVYKSPISPIPFLTLYPKSFLSPLAITVLILFMARRTRSGGAQVLPAALPSVPPTDAPPPLPPPPPPSPQPKGKGKRKGKASASVSDPQPSAQPPPPTVVASLPLAPSPLPATKRSDRPYISATTAGYLALEGAGSDEELVSCSQPRSGLGYYGHAGNEVVSRLMGPEYDEEEFVDIGDADFDDLTASYVDPHYGRILLASPAQPGTPRLVLPVISPVVNSSPLYSIRAQPSSTFPSSPIVAVQRLSAERPVERPAKRARVEEDIHPVTDVVATHHSRLPLRLPNPSGVRAQDNRIPGPPNLVLEDTSLGEDDASFARRRSSGNPKPHQLGFWRSDPKQYLFYARGRHNYKLNAIRHNLWATPDSRAKLGKLAWDETVKENPELYEMCPAKGFDNTVLRLFADTAWSLRGAMKSETKKLAPGHYQLNPPETLTITGPDAARHATEFTRDRVAYLLKDYKFLYGEFNGRDSVPFANTGLCMIIERAVFRTFTSGNRAFMNPMPPTLIALAATCVHNALDEWSTGCFQSKPMKEEYYGGIYRRFIRKLTQLESRRPNRYNLLMSSFYAFCIQLTRVDEPVRISAESDDDWDICGDSDDDAPF